jgi:hypothetical protein
MSTPLLAEIPAATNGLEFFARELSLTALFLLQAGGAAILFLQGAYLSVLIFLNKDTPSYWHQFAIALGITAMLVITEAFWASSIIK